ncbi:MAG: hypothetical protein M3Q07_00160, partial [Pseudobdellovibrionaceae bacterium]|nr:hypothetical protein [Pseudobdellovibrionaceae bacterium]
MNSKFLTWLILTALGFSSYGVSAQDWRTADRTSMGVAALPENEPDALVQIYAARAFKWRGYFAVHT